MSRMLMTGVILAGAIYALICALLYVYQERLIFHPDVLPPEFTYDFPIPFDELTWQVDGATINALHFRAAHAKGVILYLHGNAGSLRGWGALAQTFVPRGYDLLVPDYRGYGKSTSRITGEAMLHQDALVAYSYLQRHYREDQIVVYGRSLGTGIAAKLAAALAPRLLLLETPYVSLQSLATRQFPFVPPALLKYRLRTDLWIGAVRCPIYLIHGTRDELIPYESSVQLLSLIKAPRELISIDGGHHNDLAAFPQYQAALDRILW